ncbi:MAG: hypothetical protein AAB440_00980 [Patescibacteria group bacterium]
MPYRPEQGPEFPDVAKEIGKNIEVLRKAGKLKYRGEYVLNASPIICEVHPRQIKEGVLGVNINAYQETEKDTHPPARLVLKEGMADSQDVNSFLSGVDFNKFVLSVIASQREQLHTTEQEIRLRQVKIARAKAVPDRLNLYKPSAEEYIDGILEDFPAGSNPTEDQLKEIGVTADRYNRIVHDRAATIEDVAKEIMEGEEQDNGVGLRMVQQELEWLEDMEAKVMQEQYKIILSSIPSAVLLSVDIGF